MCFRRYLKDEDLGENMQRLLGEGREVVMVKEVDFQIYQARRQYDVRALLLSICITAGSTRICTVAM